MYAASWIGSESSLFLMLQGIVFLFIIGLGIAAFILRARGNRLWVLFSALFVLSVLPFLLGGILPYEIQVPQSEFGVDYPIDVDIVVKNPYPLPVWYPGFDWIMLDAVPSDTPLGSESGAASTAAGQTIGRDIVMPWGMKVVYSRRFSCNETGGVDIRMTLKEGLRTVVKTEVVNVIDIKEITLNSTGISLIIVPSKTDLRDRDYVEFILVIKNDNRYPVKIPVFSKIYMGTAPDELMPSIYISWLYPHFEIDAGSNHTLELGGYLVRYPSFSLYVSVEGVKASIELGVEN